MATVDITRGTTLPNSSAKSDFHNLVDTATATVTNIVNADVDSAAEIASSKLDLSGVGQAIVMSSKAIKLAKGADVASANALTLGTDGNYFDITGTTTITSIGTLGVGTVVKLHFDGILTFTHHATDLILPGGANITTAAGDECELVEYATGDWRCASYTKASGASVASATGQVVQMVRTSSSAVSTGTTQMPYDDTIPQNTEGDEYMTMAITPSSTSNRLVIIVTTHLANNTSAATFLSSGLFQDSTASALAASAIYKGNNNDLMFTNTFVHEMAAGTVSSTTFKVRSGGNSASTTTFNGQNAGREFGGVVSSSITIFEVKA